MKINGNAVRPGFIIEHQGRLWRAIKIQHTQPGKGGAYLQVELKDVRIGTKLNERFRSSETVERVALDKHDYQFLFADGDDYTLMDQETFEQIVVNGDLIGEPAIFLQEGMKVTVESHEGEHAQRHPARYRHHEDRRSRSRRARPDRGLVLQACQAGKRRARHGAARISRTARASWSTPPIPAMSNAPGTKATTPPWRPAPPLSM